MNILSAIILLLGSIYLSSCSQRPVFVTSKYKIPIEDKRNAMSYVRVVNVIDNRKVQDSIIGVVSDDLIPYCIDRPLAGYLKEMFNQFISKPHKGTDSSAFIPVTIYINDFYLDRRSSNFNYINFYSGQIILDGPLGRNHYSYKFEYKDEGIIRSYTVEDAIDLRTTPSLFMSKSEPSMYDLGWFFIQGIREAAQTFRRHLKERHAKP